MTRFITSRALGLLLRLASEEAALWWDRVLKLWGCTNCRQLVSEFNCGIPSWHQRILDLLIQFSSGFSYKILAELLQVVGSHSSFTSYNKCIGYGQGLSLFSCYFY